MALFKLGEQGGLPEGFFKHGGGSGIIIGGKPPHIGGAVFNITGWANYRTVFSLGGLNKGGFHKHKRVYGVLTREGG